jgi:hypothetical protein
MRSEGRHPAGGLAAEGAYKKAGPADLEDAANLGV